MASDPLRKVTAYITASRAGTRSLLVFEEEGYEHLGLQVPGGTVNEGESLDSAVLREIREESGIGFAQIRAYLGEFPYVSEKLGTAIVRHYYWLELDQDCPDRFTHVVTSEDEDNGWVYHYRWEPLTAASPALYAHLGRYLPHLPSRQ